MRNRRNNARRLRAAVEALPRHTKLGMLEGINRNRVIVGDYTDKRGGVCPMLAAHRNGGRTDFGSFALAWDAYTGAKKARRASAREVRTLRGYLEVALIREGIAPPQPGDTPSWAADRPLAFEVRDVQASRRRLAAADAQEDAEVTIEDLLAGTYAASEQERTERLAEEALATDHPTGDSEQLNRR